MADSDSESESKSESEYEVARTLGGAVGLWKLNSAELNSTAKMSIYTRSMEDDSSPYFCVMRRGCVRGW